MIEDYELIVIGGGIIGAACAYEASSRGIKVLLVEKSDFGSETSQGSFKIVHGGLRYLQHLDLPRLRESVRSQNYVRRFAPNLVKPLPFIVPCYGYGMKGREVLSLACEIYSILSCDRNRGVAKDQILPKYKVLSTDQLLEIAPYLEKDKLRGGVVFYDSQMLDPDRLILQVLLSAERQGAYLKNYTRVESIVPANNIYEVNLINEITKEHKKVFSKYVINAMGPWAYSLKDLLPCKGKYSQSETEYYSKGIQLAVKNYPLTQAISIQTKGLDTAATISRGGRAIFLQPWRNLTLIGTTDSIYKGKPDGFRIGEEEIIQFFKEVCDAYPDPKLKKAEVAFAFGGLRPIDPVLLDRIRGGEARDGLVNTSRDEEFIDHKSACVQWNMPAFSNIVSIVGIKYTTYRSVAVRVLDCLAKKGLSKLNRGSDYFHYGDPIDVQREIKSILDMLSEKNDSVDFKQIAAELWELFGLRAKDFVSTLRLKSDIDFRDTRKLIDSQMICYSVQNEYAKTVEDILLRRYSSKFLVRDNDDFVSLVKEVCISILKWDREGVEREIGLLVSQYRHILPREN
jgi:glycerol-3-phosphate dehydrogenase